MSQLACTPGVYTYRQNNMKDCARTKFSNQVAPLNAVLNMVLSDFEGN